MSEPANQFERAARDRKALALAREIYHQMLTCVGNLTEEDWKLLAQLVGVAEPSKETQLRVNEILRAKNPTV